MQKSSNIIKAIKELHTISQSKRSMEINDYYFQKDTNNLMEKMLVVLQDIKIVSLQKFYSIVKNIPIKEIDKNWREKYARTPLTRNIRKVIYLFEESGLLKNVRVKIDEWTSEFNVEYTQKRFELKLKQNNITIPS